MAGKDVARHPQSLPGFCYKQTGFSANRPPDLPATVGNRACAALSGQRVQSIRSDNRPSFDAPEDGAKHRLRLRDGWP